MSNLAPLLVRANAGTGKTFALSSRFLALMFRGVPPHQILATTFTRKAAGEIQARIFQRLAEAASSENDAGKLAKELGVGGVTQSRAAELLALLVRDQHRLSICTIDSLCIRFLSMFAAELGFPGGITISSEDQDHLIRREAVAEVLAHDDRSLLIILLRMMAQGVDRRALHSRLEDTVTALHTLYMESGEAVWRALQELPTRSNSQLVALVEQLSASTPGLTKEGKPSKSHLDAIGSAVEAIKTGSWGAILTVGLGKAIVQGQATFSKVPIPDVLRAALEPLVAHAKAMVWNGVVARTAALGRLLSLYDTAYWKLRRSRGSFSFSDVKEILVQGAVMGQLDELYYRLDTRYAHLLFDEFQDTSMLDWKLLQPIAAEVLSKVGVEHTFLCVGDVKQAIYGFRGGVAEIFNTISERWEILEPATLDTSYRSAPEIMEFSNRVFDSLGSNAALAQFQEVASRWQSRYPHHRTTKTELPGHVEVNVLVGDFEKDELHDAQLASAVKRVEMLVREAPWCSVGVLVPTNRDVRAVIQALAKSASAITASEEGGVPLTDSAAVLAFLALFTLVDHPGDTIARFHVAHSPLGEGCGVLADSRDSEVARAMAVLRAELLQRGYGAVIHALIRRTATKWSAQGYAQLIKLSDIAFAFDERRGARAADFVELVQRNKQERPQAAGVRVMTYHKSKGLEFDAVVLPFLHNEFVGGREKSQVWLERPSPVEPPTTIVTTVSSELLSVHPLLESTKAAMRATRVMDALNVLYVALTRPRQGLYITLPPSPHRKSAEPLSGAAVIRAALGLETTQESPFTLGDPQWCTRERTAEASSKLTPTVLPKIALARPTKRVRTTTFVAPSSLEGGESCVVAERLFRQKQGAEEGTIFHTLFETLEWLPLATQAEAAAVRHLERFALGEVVCARFIGEWRRMLAAPKVSSLLQKATYEANGRSCELFRELPFVHRDGQQLLRGAMDRVVVSRRGEAVDTVTILDYKTDSIELSQLAERTELYRPQIEVYKKAAQRIFGVESKRVVGKLLFTRVGEVTEL